MREGDKNAGVIDATVVSYDALKAELRAAGAAIIDQPDGSFAIESSDLALFRRITDILRKHSSKN